MYQRQVSFVEAIKMAFNKYCCFTGRASRSEYWWWSLFNLILSLIFTAVFGNESMFSLGMSGLLSLAMLLPSLGLAVRRLHDINKSGWWLLIGLVPVVGVFVVLIFFIKESDSTPNRYGVVPNLVA